MRKLGLIIIVVLSYVSNLFAQNTIAIRSGEVNTESETEFIVSLENTEAIAAMQFDINFNASAFALSTGHYLTTRGANHTLAVSSPSSGIIRVILYSNNNESIVGNTGDLIHLKLNTKTLPGNFNLGISNLVVSSPTGTNITASGQSGNGKVLGPLMNVVTSTIAFGRVPIGTNPTRSISVQNNGNLDLVLSSVNDITPFSIVESFPLTISANSSRNLTLTVDTANKYNNSEILSFENNDADPLRSIQKVNISAEVYAVNELKIGSASGDIHTEIEIPVIIDNMEEFTGFQFDISIPTGIQFVENSIVKSTRVDDHEIQVSVLNENTIRFLGYSGANKNFLGNSGEVFSFKLKPKVSSGTYYLSVSNAIISNVNSENIISDSYQGSIQINSPSLSLNPSSISFGAVPITETRQQSVRISNYGSAALVIDEVVFGKNEIGFDVSLPLTIPNGSYEDVNLTFTPTQSGSFSENISIRHNGPQEQHILSVQANVFSPNFLQIQDQEAYRNETNEIQLLLKNNDPVKALQFDITLPTGFLMDVNNLVLKGRAVGFDVSSSLISGNTYRVLIYSLSGLIIDKGETSILGIPVLISNDVSFGTYTFSFSNEIISDENSLNVKSLSLQSGQISVVLKDTDGDGVGDDDDLCPNTPSGETVNTDGCSQSQIDDDGDSVMNDKDLCPNTPTGEAVNANGCSQSQIDDDGDGVMNDKDLCPNTPTGETVNTDGCSQSQIDDDGDGVMNDKDLCPDTPTGETVDTNGCSQSQIDDDGDGVMNDKDLCPDTPTGETVNTDGCSQSQIDDDGDGVMNDKDLCPNTPTGETVNTDGCSQSQIDDDGDGVMNDKDLCPDTPTGEAVNTNGCSQSQIDDDGDGVMNDKDLCPDTSIGEIVNTDGCSDSQLGYSNYLVIDNSVYKGESNQLDVLLKNDSQLKAVQFDLELPVGISLDLESLTSTPRTNGFNISSSEIAAQTYRIIMYSLSGLLIESGNTSILGITVVVDETIEAGNYTLNISNVVLSNTENKNVKTEPSETSKIIVLLRDGDGDGVTDDIDACPNTPTGETVDVNGCSQSQLDDDGDGVMNDKDLCSNTPTGETVSTDGCSQSQIDDDGDGVMNDKDLCLGTPAGVPVNQNGCVSLSSNNFTIETISETCPDKNNGLLLISSNTLFNFVATLNGTDYDFNSSKTIDNLSPGSYELCIEDPGVTEKYCYNFEILEGTTVSAKSSVTSNKVSIEIVEGTAPFEVLLNGKSMFKTNFSNFDLDVKHGDYLEIKTGISCEGVYSKSIEMFDDFVAYPNPTNGLFEISIPTERKEVEIAIFNMQFQLISRDTYLVKNGKVQLNIENQPTGVYFAKVFIDNPISLKIYRY